MIMTEKKEFEGAYCADSKLSVKNLRIDLDLTREKCFEEANDKQEKRSSCER